MEGTAAERTFAALSVIEQHVKIEDVVAKYVPEGTAQCPFETRHTDSFRVYPALGSFACLECNTSGNSIAFVQKKEGMSFQGAIRYLLEDVGFTEQNLDAVMYGADPKTILTTATEIFQENLRYSDVAKDALRKRNVTPEIAEEWRLGYAQESWDALTLELHRRGHSGKEVAEYGLARERPNSRYSSHYDFFRNRIMIPIEGMTSDVIGFAGRALGDDLPKYVNTPETPVFKKGTQLFALRRAIEGIRASGTAILAEGYFDAISAHSAGLTNAVSPMGTALTAEQAKLLQRYTDEVYILMDGDEAGINAAERAAHVLMARGMTVYASLIPDSMDLDDYLRASHTPQDALSALPKMSLAEFLLYNARTSENGQDQWQVINRVADALAFDPIVERRMLVLNEVARRCGVDPRAVYDIYRKKEPVVSQGLHNDMPAVYVAGIMEQPHLAQVYARFIPPESKLFSPGLSLIYTMAVEGKFPTPLRTIKNGQRDLFQGPVLNEVFTALKKLTLQKNIPFPSELVNIFKYGKKLDHDLRFSKEGDEIPPGVAAAYLRNELVKEQLEQLHDTLVKAKREGNDEKIREVATSLERLLS